MTVARTETNERRDSPPQAFEDDFAVRVTDARGRLTSNDQRVIDHLRREMEGLAFHTSDSLARSAGVSRAAIVRFAHKLGYAGFTELRDAARGAIKQRQESPLGRFSVGGEASLLDRKAEQDTRNLTATQALAREAIPQAAQALARSEAVYVAGYRKTYGLALYVHRMLETIRPEVHILDAGFTDELAQLERGDVFLALLFQRYSRLTISLIQLAKEAGAEVIVVTDGGGHDFAEDADHVLAVQADSPALYDSMVAAVWALETLVAEAAAFEPDRSRQMLEAVERHAEDLGLLLD